MISIIVFSVVQIHGATHATVIRATGISGTLNGNVIVMCLSGSRTVVIHAISVISATTVVTIARSSSWMISVETHFLVT
jgi:hypothetical protein